MMEIRCDICANKTFCKNIEEYRQICENIQPIYDEKIKPIIENTECEYVLECRDTHLSTEGRACQILATNCSMCMYEYMCKNRKEYTQIVSKLRAIYNNDLYPLDENQLLGHYIGCKNFILINKLERDEKLSKK